MKTDSSLVVGFEVSHRHIPMPILAIVGSLLGLLYIIVLPFIGLVGFILFGGYRVKQNLATIWRGNSGNC